MKTKMKKTPNMKRGTSDDAGVVVRRLPSNARRQAITEWGIWHGVYASLHIFQDPPADVVSRMDLPESKDRPRLLVYRELRAILVWYMDFHCRLLFVEAKRKRPPFKDWRYMTSEEIKVAAEWFLPRVGCTEPEVDAFLNVFDPKPYWHPPQGRATNPNTLCSSVYGFDDRSLPVCTPRSRRQSLLSSIHRWRDTQVERARSPRAIVTQEDERRDQDDKQAANATNTGVPDSKTIYQLALTQTSSSVRLDVTLLCPPPPLPSQRARRAVPSPSSDVSSVYSTSSIAGKRARPLCVPVCFDGILAPPPFPVPSAPPPRPSRSPLPPRSLSLCPPLPAPSAPAPKPCPTHSHAGLVIDFPLLQQNQPATAIQLDCVLAPSVHHPSPLRSSSLSSSSSSSPARAHSSTPPRHCPSLPRTPSFSVCSPSPNFPSPSPSQRTRASAWTSPLSHTISSVPRSTVCSPPLRMSSPPFFPSFYGSLLSPRSYKPSFWSLPSPTSAPPLYPLPSIPPFPLPLLSCRPLTRGQAHSAA